MINDNMKIIIDNLQTRIDNKSNNTLYIFDTKEELEIYKKKHKNDGIPSFLFITIKELRKSNLIGLRYKNFHFVREDEIDA